MRDQVPLTIGVTGHRALVPAQVPAVEAAVQSFIASLPDFDGHLPVRFLTGLAEGVDRLVARIALEAGCTVVAVLPFEQAEYERDFGDPGSLEEFRSLLARCEVVELEGDGRRRELGYAGQGMFISDHCQILMAIWDGEDLALVGGTSQVVNFHQFGTMDGAAALTARRDPLAEDDSDLVFHIRIDRPEANSAEASTEVSTRYLIADPERREVQRMPQGHRLMMERIADFNRDSETLAPLVAPDTDQLAGWSSAMEGSAILGRIGALFARADQLAIHFQRHFRAALKWTYVIAALMGLSFIAYADLNLSLMIYAFLLLFAAGLAIHWRARANGWHRRYLDYRALAEGLRVQFYWQLSGVSGRQRNDFAYDNFLQKQDVEIGWIRNVMSFASTPLRERAPVSATVDEVIDCWIGAEVQAGQAGYFRAKAAMGHRRSLWTARIGAGCLWAGIGVSLVLAVFGEGLSQATGNVLVVLMGILPLAAGVRAAYAHKVAEKELIKQYRFMAGLFERARHRLRGLRSEDDKRRILRAVGEAALDEHAEWILMHRERPLAPGQF